MNRSLQGIPKVARALIRRPTNALQIRASSTYIDQLKNDPPVDTLTNLVVLPVVIGANPSLLLVDLYFAVVGISNYTEYSAYSIWLDYIKRKRQLFICLTDALLKLAILYWIFG